MQSKPNQNTMRDLAKQICQYNGQNGTDKQIDRCIKLFKANLQMMQQFAKGRIPSVCKGYIYTLKPINR